MKLNCSSQSIFHEILQGVSMTCDVSSNGLILPSSLTLQDQLLDSTAKICFTKFSGGV